MEFVLSSLNRGYSTTGATGASGISSSTSTTWAFRESNAACNSGLTCPLASSAASSSETFTNVAETSAPTLETCSATTTNCSANYACVAIILIVKMNNVMIIKVSMKHKFTQFLSITHTPGVLSLCFRQ